jgi:hypothetical protein
MTKWQDKEAAIRALEFNGTVNPDDLIEAARDESHPCHGDFTWDVQAAAEKQWRNEARQLIRRCNFEVVYDDVTHPVVAYVSEPTGDAFYSLRRERSVSRVSSTLVDELTSLLGYTARVHGIAMAKRGIVGDRVVDAIGDVRGRIRGILDGLEMGDGKVAKV